MGLRYIYRLIDLDLIPDGAGALSALLDSAQTLGFRGLNITHPCKQQVIPLLDGLSDVASSLGAVNTVVFSEGKRIGHNTDWSGFTKGFRRGLPDVSLKKVLQLGAGGAGAAVANAALSMGAGQILISDFDLTKAEALVENLRRQFGVASASVTEDVASAMAEVDGLIHATPTGMDAHPGLPLPAELLEPRHWVSEVVYFPLETELLRVARSKGCRTNDGGGMATFQAFGAMKLFTGMKPDGERMLRHFRSMVLTEQATIRPAHLS